MKKEKKPSLKTAEFAKLCNTNKRTLIHYDSIGLFSPAFTDTNGYRYYSERQCDLFFTIRCLKDIGMPLKEIKRYIDHKNPKDMAYLLREQQKRVEREIRHMERMQSLIATKLQLIEAGAGIRFEGRLSTVTLQEEVEEYFITTPPLEQDAEEHLFALLCEHIGYCNREDLHAGHPYGAMLSTETLWKAHQETYHCFFTKVNERKAGIRYTVKPAGVYAVVYLKGDYYEAGEAFSALHRFFQERGLSWGAYCYKEAIWDESMVQEAGELITKISVPVQEREA